MTYVAYEMFPILLLLEMGEFSFKSTLSSQLISMFYDLSDIGILTGLEGVSKLDQDRKECL